MKTASLCDEHPLAQEIAAQEAAMWAEYDMEQVTGRERVIPMTDAEYLRMRWEE